jgi:hypothetical protein
MKNDSYTVKYIAETYTIPRSTIISAIERGKLTAGKLSDIWLITADEKLKSFLERYKPKNKEK